MGIEIERKWLLKELPLIQPLCKYYIEQFYLSCGNIEVRICSKFPASTKCNDNRNYILCIKSSGTLVRDEIELIVTEKDFYNLLFLVKDKKPIFKEYYKYIGPYEGVLEVSIVDHGAFIYAEMEFSSIEEAQRFEFPWPQLIEKEVTDDPSYKMKNYWKRTREESK